MRIIKVSVCCGGNRSSRRSQSKRKARPPARRGSNFSHLFGSNFTCLSLSLSLSRYFCLSQDDAGGGERNAQGVRVREKDNEFVCEIRNPIASAEGISDAVSGSALQWLIA